MNESIYVTCYDKSITENELKSLFTFSVNQLKEINSAFAMPTTGVSKMNPSCVLDWNRLLNEFEGRIYVATNAHHTYGTDNQYAGLLFTYQHANSPLCTHIGLALTNKLYHRQGIMSCLLQYLEEDVHFSQKSTGAHFLRVDAIPSACGLSLVFFRRKPIRKFTLKLLAMEIHSAAARFPHESVPTDNLLSTMRSVVTRPLTTTQTQAPSPPPTRSNRSLTMFFIEIDNNRTTFLPGQRIDGHVAFTLQHPADIKLLRIRFVGHVVTHIYKKDAGFSGDSSHITLFKDLTTCLGSSSLTDPPVLVEAGEYIHPFSFRFPAMNLPASFEGRFGRVRYEVAAVMVRPGHVNKTCSVSLTVPSTLDANDPVYNPSVSAKVSESIGRFVWKSGHVELKLSIPRQAYASEDMVPLRIDITNQSSAFLQLNPIRLKQKASYRAAEEMRGPHTEKIHRLNYSELFPPHLKHITRIIQFPIPACTIMTPDIRTAILEISHCLCVTLYAYPLSKKVKRPEMDMEQTIRQSTRLEPPKRPMLFSTLSTDRLSKVNKWMFWKYRKDLYFESSASLSCDIIHQEHLASDTSLSEQQAHHIRRALSWNGPASRRLATDSEEAEEATFGRRLVGIDLHSASNMKPHRQSMPAPVLTDSVLVPRKNIFTTQKIKAEIPLVIGGFPHMLLEVFNDGAESIRTLPEYHTDDPLNDSDDTIPLAHLRIN